MKGWKANLPSVCYVNKTLRENVQQSTADCHHNSQQYDGRSKGEYSGVKWRGGGNPWIHIGKSDSLSPPDKSPLDKCGQAAEEPASVAMGCRTAIRMKLYWANGGAKRGGPRLRNSANSNAHSSSYWLNLLKNLHIGIHHTQQIQVRPGVYLCVLSVVCV